MSTTKYDDYLKKVDEVKNLQERIKEIVPKDFYTKLEDDYRKEFAQQIKLWDLAVATYISSSKSCYHLFSYAYADSITTFRPIGCPGVAFVYYPIVEEYDFITTGLVDKDLHCLKILLERLQEAFFK